MKRGRNEAFCLAFLFLASTPELQGQADAEFAAAEKGLRALETAQPNTFEVRYRLGLILLRQNKPKEAAQRFQAAVGIMPSSALAWVGLAQARLRLSQKNLALEAAGRALTLAPQQPPTWRALAIFYNDAHEFLHAAECEERWGQATPADLSSKARAAASYVAAGNASRAARQPARAVEAYQNAIRVAPEEKDAYFALAALLLDHRTPEPATAVLDSAAARFPQEPEFRRLLGLAHYQLGNIPKAISAFFAASDLDPDSETGYASLETLLDDAGNHLPEIIRRFQSLRTRQPSSPVGHYLLARSLTAKGSPAAEVEPLLRQAIQVEPAFWPAHYELGQLMETQDKLAEGILAESEAVRLNPQYAPAHFLLAKLYARSGEREKAVQHRRKHSDLLAQEKQLAARARAESPALRYRTESSATKAR